MTKSVHPNLPKYVRLAEQLRGDIEAGVLRPGDRLPGFTQVQEHYGTSKQTLERAHSLLQQEGLIERVNGIGTFVAARPVRAKTGVIGVMIGLQFYHRSYYARIMHGIQQVAQREKVELLLLHEMSVVKWARADGVLMLSPLSEGPQNIPPTMPRASVLRSEAGMANIGVDEFGGVRDATRHLLELGHRRIAYLVGDDWRADDRLHGYHAAMQTAGIEVSPQWIRRLMHRDEIQESPFLYHSGRASMRKWLRDGWRDLGCTALLAQNDETAIGAVEELQAAGLRVPHDVSVVGFDGIEAAEYFRPRLTTVQVPLEETGAAAADYLLRQIWQEEGSQQTRDVLLPTQVKIGDSTAPPPGS